MVISLSRVKKTALAVPGLIKKYAVLFISLHLINVMFNQTMIYFQELRMTTHQDDYIPYMLGVALIGFFVQAGIKVIWTFIICRNFSAPNVPMSDFIKDHFEKGIIESLRAFLKSIKWGFLFILPGILKAIRFQFVNFIICTNSKYDKGEVDALKASENLTKGHLLGLFFLFVIFAAIAMTTTSSHLLINRPFSVLSLEALSIVLMTFEITYIYFIFEDMIKKGTT
jgi:hypothetical protein